MNVDTTQIQKRIIGICAAGTAVRVVNQDGTVTCEPVGGGASGTVTNVGTGAGLTSGPITTTGTLNAANLGITNAMLANNSVEPVGTTPAREPCFTAPEAPPGKWPRAVRKDDG